MTTSLLLAATVILACVVCNKISNKIGTPMLLAFLFLGMLFGTDGLVKVAFDDFALAEQICSIALIFIMFYGGFGTNWSEAKPVAAQAIALSSLGTLLTAGFVGLFCHFVLRIALLESFLIGAVICSTDAASVFSILRSKRLNLRDNTASLLEVESGSNDPFSYMLTIMLLSAMHGEATGGAFVFLFVKQIVLGLLFGVGVAVLTLLFLSRFKIHSSGFVSVFLVAVSVFAYALPMLWGGNGYLSTYITGIILGNQRLESKQELVHFFDGATGLMQMLLFFLLGLLSFPSQLPQVALPALLIALFLTFLARPAAVFLILAPFRSPLRQRLLVSWAGLRGAASIVFAIMTVIHPVTTNHDLFHMVFFIVLFSILLQGTLLPVLAKRLGATEPGADVMKTFNDYTDKNPVRFLQFTLPAQHVWAGKQVSEITLPPDSLLALLTREGQEIVPTGKTVLCAGDQVVLGGLSVEETENNPLSERYLVEQEVEPGSKWVGKQLGEIQPKKNLVVLIKRAQKVVIPKGDTVLLANDVLVLAERFYTEEAPAG